MSPDPPLTAVQPAAPIADSDSPGGLAIQTKGLGHRYPGSRRRARGNRKREDQSKPVEPEPAALVDVSFEVREGEIFGILGPNGSGKTTLFRILSTLLAPSSGCAMVFGDDLSRDPARVRRNLGVVFQMPSLDGKLTARENLMHQGHLYGLRGPALDERIGSLLSSFALGSRSNEFVERFSGGMRRRVELAKALLHRPRLLLLDEPSTGLDPGARADLWKQLETLRSTQGVTVALTTHLMEEADRCDRLAIIHEGRFVAVETPTALKDQIGGDVIVITPRVDAEPHALGTLSRDLAATIEQRFGPWSPGGAPRAVGGEVRLEKRDGAALVPILSTAFPGRINSISVGQPTLQDVFLHLTGHTLWGTGAD